MNKKMQIIIVEDELSCCRQLEKCLKDWGMKHGIPITVTSCKSGDELLLHDYRNTHLIFMDIELPGISGMETARMIRKSDYKGHIIFLTAYSEHVFDGYHVRATDYLLKPITPEVLENCLTPILQEHKSSSYVLRTATSIDRIPYSHIIAFATQGHYIDIITDEQAYRQKISLKTLKQLLPENFIQCHRTLIVNINHVTKLDGKNLYLTNQTVYPISRPYMESVQTAFMNCITGNG